MTVDRDSGTDPGSANGNDQSKAGRVADVATSEASDVASTAAEGAREIAGEATEQVKAVASHAKQQLDGLIQQSRDEFRQLAEDRGSRAASGLRTVSQQVSALSEGRPDDAGPLVSYLSDAQGQVQRLATRLEQGGPQEVINDVTSFARRRPGMFLAGAMGAGFLVGRLARAAAASSHGDDEHEAVAGRPMQIGESMTSLPPERSALAGPGFLPPSDPDPRTLP